MNPSNFKFGTLSRGSRLVSGCENAVFVGPVVTAAEGIIKQCHVKFLDEAAFIVESVCSWVLLDAGIPTPEPYWVYVSKMVMPRESLWPYGKRTDFLCFGTKTIDGARKFRFNEFDNPVEELLKWEHYIPAAVFDEAIANDDRGMHNILTTGKKHWLIDHNRAFVNKYTNHNALRDTEPLFTNTLLKWLANENHSRRLKVADKIKTGCSAVFKSLERLPYESFSMDEGLKEGMRHFLDARIPRLIDLCMHRLDIHTLGAGK